MSQTERLDYEIHSVSSFSPPYSPANILTATPHDPASRWSTASAHHEFITLKLAGPAVVEAILFGKLDRVHPCNLNHFTVHVGMRPEKVYMKEILRNRLQNDTKTERFELNPHVNVNHASREPTKLPMQYVRIEVLDAQSPNFNISLWHVLLEGRTSIATPDDLEAQDQESRNHLLNQSLLSHLRSSRELLPVYSLLQQTLATSSIESSGNTVATFEHPLLTELHRTLVAEGDYDASEQLLESAYEQGLFSEWERGRGESTGKWELLGAGAAFGQHIEAGPTGRGGHQLVLAGRRLLMFGGWNGEDTNYSDLWEWDLSNGSEDGAAGPRNRRGEMESETKRGKKSQSGWVSLIPHITPSAPDDPNPTNHSADVGISRPRGRSCAQFFLDEGTGWIYLLGGMVITTTHAIDEIDEPPGIPSTASTAAPTTSNPNNGNNSTPTLAAERVISSSTAMTPAPTRPDEDRPMFTTVAPPPTGSSELEKKSNEFSSDFWRYKAYGEGEGQWELICDDTGSSDVGGPKLIYDHTMVISKLHNKLYVLGGKFVNPADTAPAESTGTTPSGLFEYDLLSKRWTAILLLSFSKISRAGHSMFIESCITAENVESERLVIVGGQAQGVYLSSNWTFPLPLHIPPFSPGGTETLVAPQDSDTTMDRADDDGAIPNSDSTATASTRTTLIRQTHSPTIYEPSLRANNDPFSRQERFDDLGTKPQLKQQIPPPTFTARTILTTSLRTTARRTTGEEAQGAETSLGRHSQWTVITGLTKTSANVPSSGGSKSSANGGIDTTLNDVYRNRFDAGAKKGVQSQWKKVKGAEFSRWTEGMAIGSCPVGRYASQVVHDPIGNAFYVYGGNPLGAADPTLRLGDLWKLTIVDSTPKEALRRARFFLRKQKFAELCRTYSTLQALDYLQTVLSPIVDSNSPQESLEFSSAMMSVLTAPTKNNLSEDETMEDSDSESGHASELRREEYRERVKMWKEVVWLFDSDVVEPENLLLDLIL